MYRITINGIDQQYPTYSHYCEDNGVDPGLTATDGISEPDDIVVIDRDWQYAAWDKSSNGWELKIIERQLFAKVENNCVIELASSEPYDALAIDQLSQDQVLEQQLWHPVPLPLRRHIRVGWRMDDGIFSPSSIQYLQSDLKKGAVAMGEEARQAIASPVGFNEVGTWLMNYVGVALSQAGLHTPMWDMAVSIEAAKKGIAVADLKATHIAKAQNYHAMSGLIQGMVGQAKAAFTATDQATLIAESDRLRGSAMQAMANPQAAIAAVLEGLSNG